MHLKLFLFKEESLWAECKWV